MLARKPAVIWATIVVALAAWAVGGTFLYLGWLFLTAK